MLFGTVAGVLASDLAIDVGTTNTLIYSERQGIVTHEPSVVALQAQQNGTHAALCMGQAAKDMIDKTPATIRTVRPLQDGVVADCDLFHLLLTYFLRKATRRRRFHHLRVIIGVPSQSSSIEQRAIVEPAEAAGADEVYLIKEPIAAALGAGLDIRLPYGRLVVDIGGGTTEIAVISLANLVYSKTLRLGGDAIDTAVVQLLRRQYDLAIGGQTAERLKIALGSVLAPCSTVPHIVKGAHAVTGGPYLLEVSAADIHEALLSFVHTIVAEIRTALEATPPELLVDIVESGLMLTGGGALLHGIDVYLQEQLGFPVHVAATPMACVALGAGHVMAEESLRQQVAFHF